MLQALPKKDICIIEQSLPPLFFVVHLNILEVSYICGSVRQIFVRGKEGKTMRILTEGPKPYAGPKFSRVKWPRGPQRP